MNSEPVYKVVWPLGGRSDASLPTKLGPPISDLTGKTIGALWNESFRGDEMFAIIRERLHERFPGLKFVDYQTFGSIHHHRGAEVAAALPGLLRQHGCDAVIAGVGG